MCANMSTSAFKRRIIPTMPPISRLMRRNSKPRRSASATRRTTTIPTPSPINMPPLPKITTRRRSMMSSTTAKRPLWSRRLFMRAKRSASARIPIRVTHSLPRRAIRRARPLKRYTTAARPLRRIITTTHTPIPSLTTATAPRAARRRVPRTPMTLPKP